MKTISLFCVAITLSFAWLPLAAPAQEIEMDPEAMQRWQQFMTPGEEHQNLREREGKWSMSLKMWMAPGTEPTESEAEAEITSIMGGRFLQEKVKGDFGGMPFEGMALVGFDNIKKKYVSIWFDNMGTGFMIAEGTWDEDRQEIEMQTQSSNPMTGETEKGRTIDRRVSRDKWLMEMYGKGPDGEEFKMMEITYERAN